MIVSGTEKIETRTLSEASLPCNFPKVYQHNLPPDMESPAASFGLTGTHNPVMLLNNKIVHATEIRYVDADTGLISKLLDQ